MLLTPGDSGPHARSTSVVDCAVQPVVVPSGLYSVTNGFTSEPGSAATRTRTRSPDAALNVKKSVSDGSAASIVAVFVWSYAIDAAPAGGFSRFTYSRYAPTL